MKVTAPANVKLGDGTHVAQGETIDLPDDQAESLVEQGWAKAKPAKKTDPDAPSSDDTPQEG